MTRLSFAATLLVLLIAFGCSGRITARNLDKSANEAEGIPFYLPKPYLVIAKNVRYIPPPTIGLTAPTPIPEAFDPAGKEVELKATIDQERGLTLERKLAETSTFTRAEEDKINRTIEEKFQRIEEEKFQKTVTEKLDRLEEDKKLLEQKLTRLEEDKKNTTVTAPPSSAPGGSGTTETQSSVNPSPATANAPQPQQPPTTGEPASYGVATNRQVLGLSGHPVVPSSQISDGLIPETFYTYQVIYLPDLTQKYGLEINDGPGEFRSTMNLVNGWMHTGAGPIYMRDSTTAAQTVAAGAAIGNVIDSLASFGLATAGPLIPSATANALPGVPGLPGTVLQSEGDKPGMMPEPKTMGDYAELYVFEPVLKEHWTRDGLHRYRVKTVEWRLVTSFMGANVPVRMSRNYFPVVPQGAAPAGNPRVTWADIVSAVRIAVPAILAGKPPAVPAVLSKDGGSVQFEDLDHIQESNSVTIRLDGELSPEVKENIARDIKQRLVGNFGEIREVQQLQILITP